MIHGYHVIIAAYGFWLPNDPRGSWSEMVWKWELRRFGPGAKGRPRRRAAELTNDQVSHLRAGRQSLRYPAVVFDGRQAQAIGAGFAKQVAKSNYTIWACAILPEHTHLVVARHRYRVEQMANLLKGAASRELMERNLHPLRACAGDAGRAPRMWGEGEWKSYLDTDEAIENAIRYVEENPAKEGKRRQEWSFVTPFRGIDQGGWQAFHE